MWCRSWCVPRTANILCQSVVWHQKLRSLVRKCSMDAEIGVCIDMLWPPNVRFMHIPLESLDGAGKLEVRTLGSGIGALSPMVYPFLGIPGRTICWKTLLWVVYGIYLHRWSEHSLYERTSKITMSPPATRPSQNQPLLCRTPLNQHLSRPNI